VQSILSFHVDASATHVLIWLRHLAMQLIACASVPVAHLVKLQGVLALDGCWHWFNSQFGSVFQLHMLLWLILGGWENV